MTRPRRPGRPRRRTVAVDWQLVAGAAIAAAMVGWAVYWLWALDSYGPRRASAPAARPSPGVSWAVNPANPNSVLRPRTATPAAGHGHKPGRMGGKWGP